MNWEDFDCSATILNNYQHYIPTNIRCPKCNMYLKLDNSIVLTSVPPKYRYVCSSCDWAGFSYRKWNERLI